MDYAAHAREVADALIAQLREGTAPWTRDWEPGRPSSLPYNHKTGARYKGGNVVQLLTAAVRNGYSDPRWLTYKQAQEVGAQVRRRESGTRIVYWLEKTEELFDEEARETRTRQIGIRRFSYVFNAQQIDGLPPVDHRPTLPEWERHQEAEKILERSGTVICYAPGDPYYDVVRDRISLPERHQFATADRFYATALHEVAHSTGHPSRLNRDLHRKFGSEGRAREELRAEIASLIMGDELGIGYDHKRHASYVASWIRVLENDPEEILRAASVGDRIAEYVLGYGRNKAQQLSREEGRDGERARTVAAADGESNRTREWRHRHGRGREGLSR